MRAEVALRDREMEGGAKLLTRRSIFTPNKEMAGKGFSASPRNPQKRK